MKVKTVKKLRKIRSKIDCSRFTMRDFYAVCPYSSEQLRKGNRRVEIKSWRHAGMVWAMLEKMNLRKAGEEFGRTHATVLHSIDVVLNSLEGYAFDEVADAINEIALFSAVSPLIKVPKTDILDFIGKYYIDQVTAERLANILLPILNERDRTE